MILEKISKSYVIKGPASFEVDCGKMYAVIGKNGKGKTTLLRILSGNVFPDNGRVTLNEETYCFPIGILNTLKYQRALRNAVLYIEDQNYLYQNLSCAQNIKYYMSVGNFNKECFWEILRNLEFNQNVLDKRINELSLGTKQKISLSFAFSSVRPFILLDEPTLGLDIDSKKVFLDMLKNKKETKGIVISTNDISILKDFDSFLLCEDNEVKMVYDNPYDKISN